MELIDEIEVDRTIDHLKSFIYKEKIIVPFTIKNIEYEFVIVETKLSDSTKMASVYFKNLTAMKSIKRGEGESMDSYNTRVQDSKLGITGTGGSTLVFGKVFNILIAYLEKYKPDYLHFFAGEENRKSLYDKILKRLQARTSIKLNPQSINLVDGSKVQSNEFVYKIEQL